MNEELRDEVNSLAQTINNKKRILFIKLEEEKFEDVAKLRDEIQLKQKEMLEILTAN